MQNALLAILHWTLRIVRLCRQWLWGVFVLPRGNSGRIGAMGLSADFDSARLDAVSRSVLWGAGAWSPEPVPARVRVPRNTVSSAELHGAIQRRFHR